MLVLLEANPFAVCVLCDGTGNGTGKDAPHHRLGTLQRWLSSTNAMNSPIARDARRRPELFRWNGSRSVAGIRAWLREMNATVPGDLLEFWATHGGGEVFETEYILPPGNGPGTAGEATAGMIGRGLASEMIVMHEGTWVTAIDTSRGEFVVFDPTTLEELGRSPSLDEWYTAWLRQEFGDRYDL